MSSQSRRKQPELVSTSSSASASAKTKAPAANGTTGMTKKQRARDHGLRLAEMMKERRAKGLIKKPRKARSKSTKAGIFFPVNAILKKLKKVNPNRRVNEASAVLLAGVLEYLTAEVLELAGNVTRDFKKQRIIPRHLFLAIENDQELESLLKNATIVQSGVTPHIHPVLLKQKTSVVPFQGNDKKTDGQTSEKKKDKRKSDQVDENNNEADEGQEATEAAPRKSQTPKKSKQ